MRDLRMFALGGAGEGSDPAHEALFHAAFRVRYRVYNEEMGVVNANPQAELSDEFDFIPSTILFVVLAGTLAVGTLRLTLFTEEHGLPMLRTFGKALQADFDFPGPGGESRILAEASRFTVLKEYRHGKAYVPSFLTCEMFERCLAEHVTNLFIVANPAQQLMYEAAGFRAFAWGRDSLTGIESPAMHAETAGALREFIKYLKSRLGKEGLSLARGREVAGLGDPRK